MESIQMNPLFNVLSDNDKKVINEFIDFTYARNHVPNETTQRVIDEASQGKGIIGTFDSVESLMAELNA